MVIFQIIIIFNYLEIFRPTLIQKKLIKIFVTKTKIMALSNPYLVLLQHADPDRKKNSVFT